MKYISTKTIKRKPGIYFIKNMINGKVYIGQSIDCYKRLIFHRFQLLNNKHSNSYLQRSFNKHCKYNFKCGVIEYCENLTERESFYINNQKGEIYNIKEVCDSIKHPSRKPISEETRLKLSLAKKGKNPSNLKVIQQSNVRQIAYYINDDLIFIFKSCKEAAYYFGIKRNAFHYYIGKTVGVKKSSKYFIKGTKLMYYNERKEDEVDK